MKDTIRTLLGAEITDCVLDDKTIDTCIEQAKNRYYRAKYGLRSGTEDSWILDYSVAQCKLILAESLLRMQMDASTLAMIALETIKNLEDEVKE